MKYNKPKQTIKEELHVNPLFVPVLIIGMYLIITFCYEKKLDEINKINKNSRELNNAYAKHVELLKNKNKTTERYYKNILELKNIQLDNLLTKHKKLKEDLEKNVLLPLGEFEATAYDLSIQSCGKSQANRGYGITANGKNIARHSRESAMTIAVDPNIIPLGTKVYIEFPEQFKYLNGIYTANDTGSAIKGKVIDVFMGDFKQDTTSEQVWEFGRRKVKIYKILNK